MTNFINFLNESQLFTVDDVEEWKSKLQKGIKAPFVNVKKSTLGGPQNVSIMITVSLDDKKDWPNKILQNSRYFNMQMENSGSLEQFTKSHRIEKKFRKSKFKSVDDAIKKINKYIDQVK